ncbi:DUF4118 domain-containing protein [Azonexus hydrophilus]|uniref:DUF4118 domain-containing protein n=1 Tax=Azonexus hydrophilus TaxID=418702 RepID=UPI002493289E|nr:DUF4118 domain-containing protein [Azonexus hydrophilus]
MHRLKSPVERLSPGQKMVLSALACVLVAIVAAPLREVLDLANMVMLFLLTVLVVAVSLGRNPAILASVLGVLLFDVFFVPPHFSLAVSNLQYLITFAVMLATALITGHLTATLKEQAAEAERRERRTHALYEIASKLAGALNEAQVREIVTPFVTAEFSGRCALWLAERDFSGDAAVEGFAPAIADLVMASGLRRVDHDAGHALYLPLKAPMRVRGVLLVQTPERLPEADLAFVEALASLVAIAVERLHYVEVAQRSEVDMATERLRSSILSALSHDLRTPLTVLIGLADSISLAAPELPAVAQDKLDELREQTRRLAGLVGNLLEMARLNAGSVTLRQEWQSLEEVVGSSLKLVGDALGRHRLRVELPRDLPLLRFDAVLIERVLCNLLENAAKYSPADGEIRISAQVAGDFVELSVSDQGPGFPEPLSGDLFDMFVRGNGESATPGAGLGLAICRAIVDAHGGRLRVANHSTGGACVQVSLPRGEPPLIEPEGA